MTHVLALDQGTSGTKAVVVSDDAVLGLAEVVVRPTYLPGGAVEQDPRELLGSVLEAGRRAVAAAGVPIDVVTLANQGESVLAWDPTSGEPLTPIVVWQDSRAQEVCDDLREHAALIAARTGLVLDPYFTAPKQAWLRRHLTRDGVVTTTDAWLLHHLTGELVTDVSTASRSLVTDLDTGDWDPELLALFSLADEVMPRILASDEIAGTTAVFGPETPVGGLVVDQQAALLAQGCLRDGEAKCTFGTGAFLLVNAGQVARRSSAGLTTSVAWRVRGETSYCVDGQVFTAASAVRWMQDLGLISSAAELDAVAADDAGGVLAVPALAGLGAPWWRPDATATFTGMTLATGRGHLVLAVLQGIAAQVAELGAAVGFGGATSSTRLRVDGGLTQSRTLMQSVADLMQVEVEVYPSQHATPLGAAALARTALDPALALASAIVPWEPSHVFAPRWSADRAGEFRARWAAAAGVG